MEIGKLFFILFLLLGGIFVIGFLVEMRTLLVWSNFLLVPVLLLHYTFKTTWTFKPIIAVLLLFYIRDIFLLYGYFDNSMIIAICYFLAMGLLFLCVLTGIKKTKIHPLEMFSFLIMYGFLIYLFIMLQEAFAEAFPARETLISIYLLLLILLVGVSFTAYLLKSHLSSLWFLVAASAFMVSEIALFFKFYVFEDLSVNFFYPFFHIIAYYALVEYGQQRWRTGRLRFF